MMPERETDGYIYFSSFHESTKDLDDAQYGKLMRIINEYAFYGNEPSSDISGVIKMAFGLIKPQIDANKRKREEYLQSVENGKKGGAPKGNKNAAKKQPKQPGVDFENKGGLFLETTPETTINGNGNNNVNVKGNGNGDQKQPPPLSFSQIKNKITDTGYFLDDDKALEGLISKTDPSWFQEYSFIEFVAETVREGYADKPKRDRHNIFRKLLFDAANLREEYPEWRRQEKQKAEARAKKAARDKAEADAPKTCPICGKELGPRLWCPDGHGGYEFNEAGLKYDFVKQEPFDFSEMVQRFRKRTEVI